jgi:hypothetical protein
VEISVALPGTGRLEFPTIQELFAGLYFCRKTSLYLHNTCACHFKKLGNIVHKKKRKRQAATEKIS